MKKLIIIAILIINCFAYNKVQSQITDTLQWLKTNIAQNNYYIGKPFGVLLDSIRRNGVYVTKTWETSDLAHSDDQPAGTYPMDTAWKSHFKIYFGDMYSDDGAFDKHFGNYGNPPINTHLTWIYLTFTQKIPFPTKITTDPDLCGLFGPVESICRPYIVASIEVGEY